MTTLAEEYIETDVGKVQLFRGGDGPPLVYFHSAAGEAVTVNRASLEQLMKDFPFDPMTIVTLGPKPLQA